MAPNVIDGASIAGAIRSEVADAVAERDRHGLAKPGLATILVGEDPASAVYVANKIKACSQVGFEGFHHSLPADSDFEAVEALIEQLNSDPTVGGILLQLPVPEGLDGAALSALISPNKDVDGLTPASAGALALGRPGLRPCTPAGIIELLDRSAIQISGSEAVIVGRSDLVGRPLASLLLERDATVTICHSRTIDLPEVCRRADILVVAVGRPEMVAADWIKPGATVIDVGINRTDSGLIGDVDFAGASKVAGAITPVPGGVGPMTIAMLLRNTLLAVESVETGVSP